MVKGHDGLLLVGRFLLVLLFLVFGVQKLDYASTVHYMMQVGAPLPGLAAVVAIVMETLVPLAIFIGLATRPLALLLALYTLGTAIVAHHYWSMSGMARYENEINFFKNVSIIGGLLLLYVSGAGAYSIDARRRERQA
ncbi:DoxX family protein [Dyella sp. A6]|uniref:DoxX family protein n=1 Tax=Dyella aluminiiresistens TaxID=3069105 RepID=UPI002E79D8DF|nr:DoxX family protein [Dyella sp. A6]